MQYVRNKYNRSIWEKVDIVVSIGVYIVAIGLIFTSNIDNIIDDSNTFSKLFSLFWLWVLYDSAITIYEFRNGVK